MEHAVRVSPCIAVCLCMAVCLAAVHVSAAAKVRKKAKLHVRLCRASCHGLDKDPSAREKPAQVLITITIPFHEGQAIIIEIESAHPHNPHPLHTPYR